MENMNYDVANAFASIENELLDSMIRNMKRHRAEEAEEGFQWEQWQAKQLAGLEEYRRKHAGRLNDRYNSINAKMRMAILQANAAGGMAQEKAILKAIQKGAKLHKASDKLQGEFFRINERKMDALLDAVEHDMLRAESAILRMHDDQVRRAIFNAQVYANSGAGTYEKAVDMAVKDYASTGLNCVKYKDGKQVNIKSYAEMALRTASKRAYLSGEGTKRQEWGIHTVIMNKRGNACPLCLPWVGRVLIDDVWSGGTEKEASKQGYPLMSAAMAAGLYHPNCRDSHTTYFPDISTPPNKRWKKSELEEVEAQAKREARKQYAKRQQDKYRRLERTALDQEDKRKYQNRKEYWEDVVEKNNNNDIIKSDLGAFKKKLRTDKDISKNYYESLKDKFAQGSDDAKRLFMKYANGDTIEDALFEGTAHYNAKTKKISMHYGADLKNPRGAGVTWFHEHGHLIDDMAGELSDDVVFRDLLEQDALQYRVSYGHKNGLKTFDKVDKAISKELQDMRHHSAVSDIFEGITKGNVRGCAGHLDSYWEDPKNITAEAFAHMFEAQFDKVRYAEMRKYFPSSLEYFEEKLKEGIK